MKQRRTKRSETKRKKRNARKRSKQETKLHKTKYILWDAVKARRREGAPRRMRNEIDSFRFSNH